MIDEKTLYLFDTSLLVAALIGAHPRHESAVKWLEDGHAGVLRWTLAAHSLAEIFSVLTTLPLSPRISPGAAMRSIKENIKDKTEAVMLNSEEVWNAVRDASMLGLSGGVIYDALILGAAKNQGAAHLVTLNPKDFERLMPNRGDFIFAVR